MQNTITTVRHVDRKIPLVLLSDKSDAGQNFGHREVFGYIRRGAVKRLIYYYYYYVLDGKFDANAKENQNDDWFQPIHICCTLASLDWCTGAIRFFSPTFSSAV